MTLISILTTYKLSGFNLERIRKVNSAIRLTDITELLAAEKKGDRSSEERVNTLLADTEILFAMGLPANLIKRAPGLKWIQLMSAGVDHQLTPEIAGSGVVLTNSRGMHAKIIAEHIIMQMLMVVKKAPRFFLDQMEKKWERVEVGQLTGKTIGIIGLGNIGRETARLAKAFGMKVVGTRRSAGAGQRARYVDELLTTVQLPRLLKQSDFVAICTPLTPETSNLISEKELKMMKPSAYLINIARGKIVDEKALAQAIHEGRIAGAMLDAFEVQPPPEQSPLWDINKVIITPHIAGQGEDYADRVTDIFIDNLKRYIAGKRLRNIVNKKLGY